VFQYYVVPLKPVTKCESKRVGPVQIQDFRAISRCIDLIAVAYGLLLAVSYDTLHRVQCQLKFDLEDSVKAGYTRLSFWLTLQRH